MAMAMRDLLACWHILRQEVLELGAVAAGGDSGRVISWHVQSLMAAAIDVTLVPANDMPHIVAHTAFLESEHEGADPRFKDCMQAQPK